MKDPKLVVAIEEEWILDVAEVVPKLKEWLTLGDGNCLQRVADLLEDAGQKEFAERLRTFEIQRSDALASLLKKSIDDELESLHRPAAAHSAKDEYYQDYERHLNRRLSRICRDLRRKGGYSIQELAILTSISERDLRAFEHRLSRINPTAFEMSEIAMVCLPDASGWALQLIGVGEGEPSTDFLEALERELGIKTLKH